MTPGIELAQRIEQAQILVIVHAPDIFTDRTAQRHHAQPGRDWIALLICSAPLLCPTSTAYLGLTGVRSMGRN